VPSAIPAACTDDLLSLLTSVGQLAVVDEAFCCVATVPIGFDWSQLR
jgi:hypothetical protein